MQDWKLWEKIACIAVWSLIAFFFVCGSIGGLAYLIKVIFIE